MKFTWFTVSLFFKAVNTKKMEPPLWEEIYYLVKAKSEEEAIEKATQIAKNYAREYPNIDGDIIRWEFVKISSVFHTDDAEISDGMEVFSRFLRESEAISLLTPFSENE